MAAWDIDQSDSSKNTKNPIRGIVDKISPDPNHPKTFLKLSIGDPTLDGNLLPPPIATTAIQEAVASHKYDGYGPSIGYPATRAAIAEFWNKNFAAGRATPFNADDVITSSGGSHALEMAISALCDSGDTLLVPAPGFSLYGVVCSNRGIHESLYKCVPEKKWEIDLVALEKQIAEIQAANKSKIKALIINNPGNPCGSNFSREHVAAICKLAAAYKIPIISDEIYAGMTFGGQPFTSVANFPEVPAIIVSGLAKMFVAPGWRLGWMIRHDQLPGAPFSRAWAGCASLSQILIGPNTLVQAATPAILSLDAKSYRDKLNATIESQSNLCYELLSKVHGQGITAIKSTGAMYMMVGIDCKAFDKKYGIEDDVSFAKQLMNVENVQVLPGTIFKAPGFVRLVVTKPPEQLKEAIDRIVEFVKNHRAAPSNDEEKK